MGPWRWLGRAAVLVLALVVAALGLFFLPLPIPLGLPLLLVAAGMLSALSPRVRRALERLAARHPRALGWLSRFLARVAARYPGPDDGTTPP